AVEEELIQVKAKSRQDTLNYPAKLNLKIGGLAMAVGSADFAPTKAMLDVFDDLSRRADAQLGRWSAIAKADVPAFDKLVRGSAGRRRRRGSVGARRAVAPPDRAPPRAPARHRRGPRPSRHRTRPRGRGRARFGGARSRPGAGRGRRPRARARRRDRGSRASA